ncbi:hypothetical protein [Arsenicicoccus sp. oral taxon 190]|uniref:hypothetical protein n=1 Tax=Arsenicicoccus sp. oral taxon 190 TaxID=1658671 RepID=UPI00067A3F9E|nr:hypothetical protein [Arsenicicoccus sp. oral taxon 190]AKT52212.1 hypothetical protein ADJ73_14715 [Arsenicicoccus sp. oral taxon 190]
MRNRTVLLLMLPALVASAAVAFAWTRPRERSALAAGEPRGRALVWPLTLAGALAGLVLGAVIGVLAGRAGGHADLGRDAMDGTFLLVPGMIAGLGAGWARWLAITGVRRRAVRLPRWRPWRSRRPRR